MAIYNFGPWETKRLPTLDDSLPLDVSVEAPDSATFQVRVSEPGKPDEYSYQWYIDGNKIDGATSDTFVCQTDKNYAGRYLVCCVVTNKAGSVTSRNAAFSVGDTAFRAPSFTFTGNGKLTDDSGRTISPGSMVENWKLTLYSSGTLKFSELGNAASGVDVFVVGGGGAGGSGNTGYGGAGGAGGYTTTRRAVTVTANKNYTITVGAGGQGTKDAAYGADGGYSSALGIVAHGGEGARDDAGGSGGSGGAGACSTNIPKGANGGSDGGYGEWGDRDAGGAGQGTTTREFGERNGKLYAGGGGAGYWFSSGQAGQGGAGGGGAGGASNHGENGAANTGGGGGGALGNQNWYYSGGSGGSGIVIIRNKR